MTPKEKAEELIDKFKPFAYDGLSSIEDNAKQCALILVKEMLEDENVNLEFSCDWYFWDKVKEELEKL